jgi:indolepyruvate ferredoxin oxidoreductase
MAPPRMNEEDPATGRPKKREFGPWMLTALKILARMKFLRGTAFDLFGYNKERKVERALIKEYESLADTLLDGLCEENYDVCVELLSIPEMIRGYGPVKERNIKQANLHKESLLHKLDNLECHEHDKKAA